MLRIHEVLLNDIRIDLPCNTYWSTPDTGTQADGFNARFAELEARLTEVELITQDTDAKVVGLSYKVDDLTGAVAAQEDNFNKRLSEALASVREQQTQNNSLVAELCAKVQSQEVQLQKLMDEREAAPVVVESSTAVTGTPATRNMLSRAAKAAGII